jgi:Arc/MetJ family transcription regulator
MAVTSVDIDRDLLGEAKRILGAATTKSVVEQALREVVMRHRQAVALDGLARLDLALNANVIVYDDDSR